MEDSRVVSKNNTRDVSSSKKSLQRRWWERLGLVQPPEDDSRDTSTTLLQCGQEMLHLGGGEEDQLMGNGKREVSFRSKMLSTSSSQLEELPEAILDLNSSSTLGSSPLNFLQHPPFFLNYDTKKKEACVFHIGKPHYLQDCFILGRCFTYYLLCRIRRTNNYTK